MPEEGVNPVDLPAVVAHVWGWFLSLNGKRQQAMQGMNPITESEIGWFFLNRKINPELWEIEAIERLDALTLSLPTAGE